MSRFPKKEADIIALAERMIAGFAANPAVFPNPPFPPMGSIIGIRWKSWQYHLRHGELNAACAAAESAVADKDQALANLIDALKNDIRYAENTVDFDDDKLKLIGWSGKEAPTALAPPGQVRQIEAPKQGAGVGCWLFLDWKAPANGGKPAAYKVQRRSAGIEPVSDRWQDVATAIETEATLVDQPLKTELESRYIGK